MRYGNDDCVEFLLRWKFINYLDTVFVAYSFRVGPRVIDGDLNIILYPLVELKS